MTRIRGDSTGRSGAARFLGPLALVLIGLFVFYTAVGNVLGGLASREWPRADGRVTVSKALTSVGMRARTRFVFEYAYEVGSRSLTASRYSFASGSDDASSGVARHREGELIQVSYDPENPSNATVVPGVSGWALLSVLGALVMLVGGSAWGVSVR